MPRKSGRSIPIELLRTGLYEEEPLEPLTDLEELTNSPPRSQHQRTRLAPYNTRSRSHIRPHGSDSESSDEWPEPARHRVSTGQAKLLRQEKRLRRIFSGNKNHRIHQTRRWELEDGRRCRTAFRGRPDLVLKERPHIPENSPPETWLSILEAEGYELEEVR